MKFSHLTRIYTNQSITQDQTLKITNEFHYLKSVIRLKKGHIFRIFNHFQGEFLANIANIGKKDITVVIQSQTRTITLEKELTLAMCIIKPDRMNEAIKSAVQMGVTNIIPIISDRTQYKKISYDKLMRTIIQSIEQSERFCPPQLMDIMTLKELCCTLDLPQIIFSSESTDLDNHIMKIKEIDNKVAVLIGPEGGFSETENQMLEQYNHISPISLGNTVLRSETAAIAALACIQMVRT
ncbi:MAG: 16S rRNA (uracil(1498)-N(3))-methyltransferase [Rickettsiaceae bacterium]